MMEASGRRVNVQWQPHNSHLGWSGHCFIVFVYLGGEEILSRRKKLNDKGKNFESRRSQATAPDISSLKCPTLKILTFDLYLFH